MKEEQEKMSRIIFEVPTKEKSKWVKAANAYGLKLSTYIKAKVNGVL